MIWQRWYEFNDFTYGLHVAIMMRGKTCIMYGGFCWREVHQHSGQHKLPDYWHLYYQPAAPLLLISIILANYCISSSRHSMYFILKHCTMNCFLHSNLLNSFIKWVYSLQLVSSFSMDIMLMWKCKILIFDGGYFFSFLNYSSHNLLQKVISFLLGKIADHNFCPS